MLISPDIYFKTVFEWLSLLHLLLKNCDFLNTDISLGSVATRLGCVGGVFKYEIVTNFLLSLTLKEFWKLLNIWWSYGQEFFLTHSVEYLRLMMNDCSPLNVCIYFDFVIRNIRTGHVCLWLRVGAWIVAMATWRYGHVMLGARDVMSLMAANGSRESSLRLRPTHTQSDL